ncbi:hypothetical protein AK812_SmicGene36576 [Symbiodinium microadriaticum]|uniref:Uncharacterized protein n=1 Tax=Symbiodinium microadriaticum TaxID=2951 RepID=A0A1Q9CII7_SYMMI|nr:hypothetical protein AK812_SmicGene36576 [Symbiodinium microadriaticum]
MASQSGSEELAPDRPFPFPGVQDYLLEGTAVHMHRVVAGSADDPSQAHHAYRMKVWLGLLDDALVGRISYEESDEPECSFKGFGALSGVSMVPFGPALASIAGEHFAFVTAVEGPEEPAFPEEPDLSWESRLTGLEAGVSNLQKSLERLLGAGGMAAPATAPPVETPAGAGVGLPIAEAPLPGLDPTVVGAARQAGIPEAQLKRMSELAMSAAGARERKSLAPRAKAKQVNVLDESEEDEPGEAGGPAATGDPVSQAVVTMSKILASMQKEKDKGNDLEHLLDRADGGGDGTSGLGAGRSKAAAFQKLKGLLRSSPGQISASIEGLMAEDFSQAQSGPRQETMVCSARGWVEHRSHLQQYAGPIRQAWLLGGIIDAINSGSPEQAKAMALLGLASLDQAAIDGGNWLLASEYSLESAPPFSSFQRPRALDPLESKQTRLIDPRWVSLFMSRLKERDAFHAAKRNLSSGASGGAAPSGSEAPNGGQPDPPRRPPRKPKGKGDGKGDKEKT